MKKLFVYSDKYKCDIGNHVFPMEKYELVYNKLLSDKIAVKHNFVEPEPVNEGDILLAHTKEYVDDLLNLRTTERTVFSELPLTKQIIDSYIIMAAGTITSAHLALKNKLSLNIGGGFHHASADKAEGFCYINDVAVSIKKLQKEKLIKKAAVVDCDLHQGNGTAKIFENDKNVFTFSIHQENLYPAKQKSSLDIGLDENTPDKVYIDKLKFALDKISEFKPELLLFVAGADIYENDQLGALKISKKGIEERDEIIFKFALEKKIPACAVLAGGYAFNVADTVEIHYNTCKILFELLNK